MKELQISGSQIARKRKMMLLSQRKAASMIEKMYGVKLSHSYLSLIERDQIQSLGTDLKNALKDFFCDEPEQPDEEREKKPTQRIPLYGKRKTEGYIDIAGPLLADFAVMVTSDKPEMGFFCGDVLICRKGKACDGDLLVKEDSTGFTCSYSRRDLPDAVGAVVMIIKKSVRKDYSLAAHAAAASIIKDELLIEEMSRRAGVHKIDLLRSLEILKNYKPEGRS